MEESIKQSEKTYEQQEKKFVDAIMQNPKGGNGILDAIEKSISVKDKLELKKLSINIANGINPATHNYTGMAQGTTTLPSRDKIIKDAEAIYEWLIKDI